MLLMTKYENSGLGHIVTQGEVAAIPPAENLHPILASMGCGLTTTTGHTPPIVILIALMILPRFCAKFKFPFISCLSWFCFPFISLS